MTFSENVRQMRKRLFLTQEALAKNLNVTLMTVNRWETGKSTPNLSTMKQLKEFCKNNQVNYEPLETSWLMCNRKSD